MLTIIAVLLGGILLSILFPAAMRVVIIIALLAAGAVLFGAQGM